jgi:DNA-binding NtrC family response regulator
VGKKVLVVDDDPASCSLVRQILADHGVTVVDDVATAAAVLREEPHDVLLCDIRMRGGAAVVREALASLPDIGVIVMTGQGTHEELVGFLRMGALDTIGKPFRPPEVARAVTRAL